MGNQLDSAELITLVNNNPNSLTTKEAAQILGVSTQEVNTAAQRIGLMIIGGRLNAPLHVAKKGVQGLPTPKGILGLLTPQEIVRRDHENRKREDGMQDLVDGIDRERKVANMLKKEGEKLVAAVDAPAVTPAEVKAIAPAISEGPKPRPTHDPKAIRKPIKAANTPTPKPSNPRYAKAAGEMWQDVLLRCVADKPNETAGTYIDMCGTSAVSSALSAMVQGQLLSRTGNPGRYSLAAKSPSVVYAEAVYKGETIDLQPKPGPSETVATLKMTESVTVVQPPEYQLQCMLDQAKTAYVELSKSFDRAQAEMNRLAAALKANKKQQAALEAAVQAFK